MSSLDQAAAEEEVFDYEAEAELFSARNRKSGRQSSGYKRFDRAAEAAAARPPSGRGGEVRRQRNSTVV